MSLIQEALKRQKEEAGGDVAPLQSQPAADAEAPAPAVPPPAPPPGAPPPAPPVPPIPSGTTTVAPAPDQEAEEQKEKKGSPVFALFGVILLILLLAAGGIGLIWYGLQQWNAKQGSQVLVTDVTPTQAANPNGEPTDGTDGTGTDTGPKAGSTDTAATGGTTTTGPDTAHTGTPPDGTEAPPDGSDTVVSVEPPAPATWPSLEITGIVGKGLRGAAIINGRVAGIGEVVEGVEVIAIGDYGVKLEFESETRFAKVGDVIE